jgi:hypothetical protein
MPRTIGPAAERFGRIAFREEGDRWVAYFAQDHTMVGAVFLGSVAMNVIVGRPRRKQQFIAFVREAFADIVEEYLGTRPVFPMPPERAPENERAGRA